MKESRRLNIKIKNVSDVTAEGLMVNFITSLDLAPTNLIGSGWRLEPPVTLVMSNQISDTVVGHNWTWRADSDATPGFIYHLESLEFSTNFSSPRLQSVLNIGAHRSKLQTFTVMLEFANVCSETFSGADTNRVVVLRFPDGAAQVFFLLNEAPSGGTIQGVWHLLGGQYPMIPLGNERNVAFAYFVTNSAIRESSFTISFVKDGQATNFWRHVGIRDSDHAVIMDHDTRVWFQAGGSFH
jgi:hypothetical protein